MGSQAGATVGAFFLLISIEENEQTFKSNVVGGCKERASQSIETKNIEHMKNRWFNENAWIQRNANKQPHGSKYAKTDSNHHSHKLNVVIISFPYS